MAIMAAREGLAFETDHERQRVFGATRRATEGERRARPRPARSHTRRRRERAQRDRGRIARVGVTLDETALPVPDNVRAACEMLGLDPLYVANEGVMLAIVPEADAPRVGALRSHDLGRDAAIGRVTGASPVPPSHCERR